MGKWSKAAEEHAPMAGAKRAADQPHPTVPAELLVAKKGAWRGLKAKFSTQSPPIPDAPPALPEAVNPVLETKPPQDDSRVALAKLEETLTSQIAHERAQNEVTRQILAVMRAQSRLTSSSFSFSPTPTATPTRTG